ncbi:MAG: type I methionyl aminopeptidase [Clostridia bacterium]|nr:MAG: type I methionyl aminopeptidase [Clostridia bacterium]
MIVLKSARELALMREAGRIAALALQEVGRAVEPGVTTQELEEIAVRFMAAHGAIPSFKGYQGFPGAICTSVNDEVVHGIPGLRKLQRGDIISIDLGTIANEYQGDVAATFPAGEISAEVRRLLETTKEALMVGITFAQFQNRVSDISHAIQAYVERQGYSVVRDYVGHGIGRQMHEDPQVPNYGQPGRGPRLRPGMTLAIEPMVNVGAPDVRTLADNWTVVTKDGKYSAHFEHTIAITANGPQILTLP